jgi:hypothetical protein
MWPTTFLLAVLMRLSGKNRLLKSATFNMALRSQHVGQKGGGPSGFRFFYHGLFYEGRGRRGRAPAKHHPHHSAHFFSKIPLD